MRRRFPVFLTLVAWLLATGSHWDLVQTYAWSRMFMGYAQAMSLTAAAEETFSGEMCDLCKAVQKGKQEQSAPKVPATAKSRLPEAVPPSATAAIVSPAPLVIGLVSAPAEPAGRGRMAPPLPPPRAAA
jgi:hypothetical protein